MLLSVPNLIDVGVQPTQARLWAPVLEKAMSAFQIVTLPQRAGFLAQALHESGKLTSLEERLSYSSTQNIKNAFKRLRSWPEADLQRLVRNPRALAAAAYGSLNGNRSAQDGWDFRGSGPFQLTGYDNFKKAQAETGNPYVTQPDLVRTVPEHGALVAALYWKWIKGNDVMDEGDFDGLSKLVNLGRRDAAGTPNGNADRQSLYSLLLSTL